jgi:Ca2+-binding EF-hand superfamily protein
MNAKRQLAIGLFCLCLIPCLDGGAAPPAGEAEDVQDFVLLADTRPVLVRLHVRIDDAPFRAAWDDFMKQLFAYLDVNGDGTLDRSELERAPSAELLLARGGRGIGLPAERMTAHGPFATNKDQKVTAVELAAYYRKSGLAPLQVQVGPTPLTIPHLPAQQMLGRGPRREPRPGTAVAEATFALLDTAGDGKLTSEKLAAAPGALLHADRNDKEIATAADLAAYGALHQPATAADAGPVVLVHPGEPGGELARRLLRRYGSGSGTPEKTRLTRKDLGLDEQTFALLDADQDGSLDREELARFARRPPDLELTARLGTKGEDGQVEVTGKKGESPLAVGVKAGDGAVALELGAVTVRLRPGIDVIRPHGLGATHTMRAADIIDRLDEGKKGYVTESDVRGMGYFYGAFKMMDRDGDGKVTVKELVAFYEQISEFQARASAGCVALVCIEEGRGLFDLLDTDHDGRLSVHEMRQAPKLLDRLDKDGKGYISRADVPRTYQLIVRRGAAGGIGYSNIGTFGGMGDVAVEAMLPSAPEPKAGPAWFRMMDRNADGFVSRREFLGSEELFDKIDTDGDGLISALEAIKADALFRKQR